MFRWIMGEGVSLQNLLNELMRVNGTSIDFQGLPRRLYIEQSGEWIIGILFTIRDQKSFLQMIENGQEVKLEAFHLGPNRRPVEFNFFLLCRETGHGILSHYQGACGLGQFSSYIETHYTNVSARSDGMDWCRLVTKSEFQALLAELSEISECKFECATPDFSSSSMRALSLRARRRSITFGLARGDTSLATIKGHIIGIINELRLNKGSVKGRTSAGRQKVIHVMQGKNKESADDCDFEPVFQEVVSVNLLNIADSALAKRLIYL